MPKFWDLKIRQESNLFPLFLNESFRNVAISLLSLFTAIFIFRTTFATTGDQKISLVLAVLYYLFVDITKFVATLMVGSLSVKNGLKKQVYLSMLFLIVCLGFLFFSKGNLLLIFIAAVGLGLSAGFYWFARHSLIVKIGREKSFGEELGLDGLIGTGMALTVPFLGGVLIGLAGYPAMFLGSFVFVLMAFAVATRIPDEEIKHETSLREVLNLYKIHPRTFLAYTGNSAAASIYAIVFPLFLFLLLKRELALGEFLSISIICASFINLLIGRWIDIKGKREIIKLGASVSSVIWLLRFFIPVIPILLILDVIDRLTAGMTGIPLQVFSYEKAIDGHSTGRAILFQELAVCIGSITAELVIILIILFGLPLQFTFLLASAFSLLQILIINRRGL